MCFLLELDSLSYAWKIGKLPSLGRPRMKWIVTATIALTASGMIAAAQPAKEPYQPGLGEFMTATQLRHAKLWFAGKMNNWDLAAYEIDEIKEGLEDVEKRFPTQRSYRRHDQDHH